MKAQLLIVAVLGPWIAAAGAGQDPAKVELKKLEGAWTVEWVERDGKKEEPQPKVQWIITGEKLAVKVGDKTLPQGTAKIDPTKKPKAMDIVFQAEGKKDAFSLPGIYELEDASLRICYGGKERPKEFVAKGETFIIHLKRAKP
jgi:uncharacterized protein (TIGR03067 family)